MLDAIIGQISHLWNTSEAFTQITIVDEGFSEQLKWRSGSDSSSTSLVPILSLDLDSFDLLLIRSSKARRLLFCLSFITADVLRKVKQILTQSGATETVIVMSVSPDAFKAVIDSSKAQLQFLLAFDGSSATDRSYEWLQQYLGPECSGILYYPLHSFPVLPLIKSCKTEPSGNAIARCELYNISDRGVNPLSLHNIDMWDDNDNRKNISDVPAADIPLKDSVKLKGLAHELAGTLVFDLGLDPSSSIYALGNTSSLVGRHLQPLISSLSQMRSSLQGTGRVQSCAGTEILLPSSLTANATSDTATKRTKQPENLFRNDSESSSLFPPTSKSTISRSHSQESNGSSSGLQLHKYSSTSGSLEALQTASLLLIDRTQDLYTPCVHSGEVSRDQCSPPLAHRIVCALTGGRGSGGDSSSSSTSPSSFASYDIGPMTPFCPPYKSTAASASSSYERSRPGRDKEKEKGSDTDRLHRLFPAVTALPFQGPLSLCMPSSTSTAVIGMKGVTGGAEVSDHDDISLLKQALFSGSEEEGRQLLCAALLTAIKKFKGQPPVSKRGRGLGAEVLALVQALSVSPGYNTDNDECGDDGGDAGFSAWAGRGSTKGTGDTVLLSSQPSKKAQFSSLGFTPSTCLRTQALLSMSLLVIEAMQRSSKKQFTQHSGPCALWMTSCETRAAGEAEVTRLLRGGMSLGGLIMHLRAILLDQVPVMGSAVSCPPSPSPAVSTDGRTSSSLSASASLGISSKSAISTDSRSISPTADSGIAPIDTVYLLMQLVRIVSYFGLGRNEREKGVVIEKEKSKDSFPRGMDRSDNKSNGLFSRDDLSHLKPTQQLNISSSSSSSSSGAVEGEILDLSALAQFMASLGEHLKLKSSMGELIYLSKLGLLSDFMVDDLLRIRPLRSPLSPAGSKGREEVIRLDLEMEDFIKRLTGHFIELGGLSVLPPHLSPKRLHMSVSGNVNANGFSAEGVSGTGGAPPAALELGIVARSVRSFLHHRRQSALKGTRTGSGSGVVGLGLGSFLASPLLNSASPELSSRSTDVISSDKDRAEDTLSAFELIESPLQLMKRAGLDLLSSGWGRLGFNSASQTGGGAGGREKVKERERDGTYESVLVVCIVGGVSYWEVAQVQSVLHAFNEEIAQSLEGGRESGRESGCWGAVSRVVIVSSSTVAPEGILKFVS